MTLTKDDFPIGTRVRVTEFQWQETNPQVGTTGTVLDADDFQYVNVRRDGRDADDDFPYLPSELEIIAAPPTSAEYLTFIVGDRVEYRNAESPNHPDNGRQGEVVDFGSYGPKIEWDDRSSRLEFPFPQNVRHVSSTPEPGAPDLAADLRKHAALLTDDLDEVNAVIAEASEKRDSLRQDIAALKNAAARLEAQ